MSESDARSDHRLRLGIALIVLLCAAYFSGGASDNQNSRFFAIYSFIEPGTPDTGTFRIERATPAFTTCACAASPRPCRRCSATR